MRHNKLPICLTILVMVIFGFLLSSAAAQEPEFDEFVYLPLIFKSGSPSPPGCNSYEPNDTPEQANWIQDGETQIQCIVPKTDVDWVKFSVSAESELILEAADEGGGLLELGLYDSDLNELNFSYSWPDGPARIERGCGLWGDPLPAGIYYGRVDHWLNFEEIPDYEISLSVNTCPTPVVLANHSFYYFFGDLYVVGEVQNSGEIGLEWVSVPANLFNGDEQLIDTGTGYAELSVLPPGDKTCFQFWFDVWDGWSHYEFEMPTYYSISSDQLQNMTVHGDNGTYDSGYGWYRVLGFIRNDNETQVEFVKPIVTLYNASGTVIGCGSTFVSSTHLDPAQSSSFELNFTGRDYIDVASYRVQVDGSLQ